MKVKLKPIFFTSDWHIGHQSVLHPSFDGRPFESLDAMHEALIRNFNNTVPPNSLTYFLGDMGLCSSDVLRSVMDQLNGIKVIILGNHDRGMRAMLNQGFDVAVYSAKLIIEGQTVTLSHCPLRGVWREDTSKMRGTDGTENWHGESRLGDFSVKDEGQYHLHGHVHSPNHGQSQKILGKQFDVGVVANNYRPVSISRIESWIAVNERK